MRLDHIAYRTANRAKTVKFFMDAFGYKIQLVEGEETFPIFFNDEQTEFATCSALEPPEKISKEMPWVMSGQAYERPGMMFHLAPEIFVSEGTPDSIVGQWVAKRDGVGGIHHLAYQVTDVDAQMKEWTEKGLADFTSSKPFQCEDLTQVFSKYHPLTGVVYEFIQRKEYGFCRANVKRLMESTRGD